MEHINYRVLAVGLGAVALGKDYGEVLVGVQYLAVEIKMLNRHREYSRLMCGGILNLDFLGVEGNESPQRQEYDRQNFFHLAKMS
jgi:hypothetical protein